MSSTLLDQTVTSLKKNNFAVYVVETPQQARTTILNEIIPQFTPGIVSYGDSMTLFETNVLDDLRAKSGTDGWEFIDTFEKGVDRAEITERRRQALLTEVFLTGTNALTTAGQLVNLDRVGNRVGGMAWGPNKVILTIGTNKIVEGLDAAMARIREVAAPRNAKRHDFKTPCAKTGKCMDCNTPDRLCNIWTITEKSWPAGRISIVLIKGEHGL